MHLPQALASLTPHLDYWWTLASVHDGTTAQVRQRGIGCGWRPVLVFRNRPAPDGPTLFTLDVARGRRTKELHPYQQSVTEAEQWIGSLTRRGNLVVDPFLGPRTAAVAAVRLGRRFVGADTNEGHVRAVLRRLETDVDAADCPDPRIGQAVSGPGETF